MINSQNVRSITSVNYLTKVNSLEAFRPVFISGLLNLMRKAPKNNSKLGLCDLLKWMISKFLKIRGFIRGGELKQELLEFSWSNTLFMLSIERIRSLGSVVF